MTVAGAAGGDGDDDDDVLLIPGTQWRFDLRAPGLPLRLETRL